MQIAIVVLVLVLCVSGTLLTLIGALTVLLWLKTPKAPADTSNRINNIMIWWLALNKPYLFVEQWEFLRNDVEDNAKIINLSNVRGVAKELKTETQ